VTIYIFTGPTLSFREGREFLEAIYLPPVSQGDIYRVVLERPFAIGIIDGYFERVPAVWHKEILWALTRGVHVYGSSSMGALRAAELAPFGMVGCGSVFEAYRDGRIEDDDEVALVHGPIEQGFSATSEAMINIRATLAAAVVNGVISRETSAALTQIAKSTFYPSRTYDCFLAEGARSGLSATEMEDFRRWLPTGKSDQKRLDAIGMLKRMNEDRKKSQEPHRAKFSFQYTDMWDQAWRADSLQKGLPKNGILATVDKLLEELRLEGTDYFEACTSAIARFFSLEETRRQGMVVSEESLVATAAEIRKELGLNTREELEKWLSDNLLDEDDFRNLIEEESRFRWVKLMTEKEVLVCLPDVLRLRGTLPGLLNRINQKTYVLENLGLENPSSGETGITQEQLLEWFYLDKLGLGNIPKVDRHARSLGFESQHSFLLAITREYLYLQHKKDFPPANIPTSLAQTPPMNFTKET
jgi:hypothetical protein